MIQRNITLGNIEEAYKHPVAEMVQLACQYESKVELTCGHFTINAKSIMGALAVAPAKGMALTITTDGADEEEACDALEQYLICKAPQTI